MLSAQPGHGSDAHQLHRPRRLDGQDVAGALDAALPAGHQPVEEGPSDEAGPGPEGDSGDDVGAAADAAVEVETSPRSPTAS